MESREPLNSCFKFDMGGKEWKLPHDFIRGFCIRCGEIEPKVKKAPKRGRFSGKSNSSNKFNEYQ